MDYEGIMDIIMKILCVLGISNRHSKVAQVLWPKSIYRISLIHIKFLNSIIQFTCSGTPVLYGAGYAKSDFTTCLPVPQRCWGQLGRSEQAAFSGPDLGESVLTAFSLRSQHRPGSPKQAQMVLPTPLFKGRQRLLKPDQYVLVYGVPKMASLTNFPTHYYLRFL